MGSRFERSRRAVLAVLVALLPVVPAAATPSRIPDVLPEREWQVTS